MTTSSSNSLFSMIRHPDRLFIGGEWVKPSSGKMLTVTSPVTETVVGQVPEAVEADIEKAVARTREAFDQGPWPRMSAKQRGAILKKLADRLQARTDDFARLWTLEAGAAITFTTRVSANNANVMHYYADMIANGELIDVRPRAGGVGLVVREPVGVVAAITPWNAPVFLTMIKLAPALAAGCTVVVKPAPETPLDSYILAECIEAAGLPKGVVSIVAADRAGSEYLVRHPGIDKVAFTGSTATGKQISKICADRLARTTLELGGKSAAIVLDDIPVAEAIPGLASQPLFNSGQACVMLSRILVPRQRMGEYADALSTALRNIRMGDPFDPQTQVGTIASKRQYERVMDYIEIGRKEGARLATGGKRPNHLDKGYFIEPTLFVDVNNAMRIAREEIFGPVQVMIPYNTVDDSIAIANDSEYGLHGAVFTNDVQRAYEIARQLRTGNVGLKGNTMDLLMPFGGMRQSGIGREGGPEGLNSFTESKTIFLPSTPALAVA